jgi:DsbC/DsbD-like thiol-disulfide interchange protein
MYLALLSLLLAFEQPPSPLQPSSAHATVQVRTDVAWVGPEQSFHLVVVITPEEGWHVYWKDPGASGAPTEFEIHAPSGYTVGEPQFPRPSIFRNEEGITYGYEKQVAVFIPIEAPKNIDTSEANFEVTTFWLACKKICIMGEQQQKVRVSTNEKTQGPTHRDMRLAQWQRLLPKQLAELPNATQQILENSIQITGTTPQKQIGFIGIDQDGVRFLQSNLVLLDNNRFVLTIPITPENTDVRTINGLLTLGSNTSDPCYVVQVVTKPVTKHN